MEYFIDTHAHLYRDYDLRHLDEVAESGLVKQVWLLPLNLYVPEFDFAGDDEVLKVGKRYPGFFVPFGFIDYFKGPEQIDRMKEQGFAALKAIRPPKPYDDESYFPIYERAEALGMPILFHVGIISHRTREQLTMPVKTGPGNMKPSMLDGIADAANVGAILRSAAALHMDAILLSPTCCDPLHRRAVRVSMGTVFQIPWARLEKNWPQQLRSLGIKTAALALTDRSVSVDDPQLAAEERLALVLGSEGDGLSPAVIEACEEYED